MLCAREDVYNIVTCNTCSCSQLYHIFLFHFSGLENVVSEFDFLYEEYEIHDIMSRGDFWTLGGLVGLELATANQVCEEELVFY